MKRILACTLLITLLLGMTACQKSATPASGPAIPGTVELTFWAHQEAWNNSYKEIAAEFTALHPEITIKFEFFPFDDYQAKMQTSLISKTGGADIYELWGGWGIDYAQNGALAPMPEELAETVRNDCYPSTIGSLEYDGKLYGMPMEFNIESGGMLVNRHLLEQMGAEIPTTWDELIATAHGATVSNGGVLDVKGFDFVNWDSVMYLWLSMILSRGGTYLNEDGTFNLTSELAKACFAELADLVIGDQPVTDLIGLTGGSDLEGYQELFSDRTLFVPRGPWVISEGVNTFGLTYDQDFIYAPLPWFGDDVAFAAETGWALAVNGNSKQQDAAFQFLDYFFSDEVQLKHNIYCVMIPAKKSVAHSPEIVEQMPFAKVLIDILDKGQYIGKFNTDIVKEAVNNTFVDYCSGQYSSLDAALETLQGELNEKLAA